MGTCGAAYPPETAAEGTSVTVFAYVNVVVVGTDATETIPLKVSSIPPIATRSPTAKPCTTEVVSVATFEVSALFDTLRYVPIAPPKSTGPVATSAAVFA